jgi:glutamate synthase (NADPH/NADH) small chain
MGFLKHPRQLPHKRPADARVRDWCEVYEPFDRTAIRDQASRCMDCGIPFCHDGCPLGNRIPDWNDLVRTDRWPFASEQLHATNNFPEMTGRLCPAPCEAACVLGIADDSVTIKQVEVEIINRAYADGLIVPQPASTRTGKRVAVIGSGPAGLAAAQQLTRAGHHVVVYERDDAIGGLCRYGIPDFKFEKRHLEWRLAQMAAEGTQFVTSCEVGVALTVDELRARYDAVVLAVGALQSRDVPGLPGRHLPGVHLAMDHLVPSNRVVAGLADSTPVDAAGKHVVIVGGGDTAADCLGTAHRQGAASVVQLDIYPEPPAGRDPSRSPWPTWPAVLRTYPAHEEGGRRVFAVALERVVGTDHVEAIEIREVEVTKDADGNRIMTPVADRPERLPADMVLLAIGFDGVEPESALLTGLGIRPNRRGTIGCGPDWQTSEPGVFVCGDAKRGASLVVWAIAEGRAAAAGVDTYLMGSTTLPSPVHPTALPMAI